MKFRTILAVGAAVALWVMIVAAASAASSVYIDVRGSKDPARQDLGVYRAESVTLFVERSQGTPGASTPEWPIAEIDLSTTAPKEGTSQGTDFSGAVAGKVQDTVPFQQSKTYLSKGVAYQVAYRPRLPSDTTWLK